MVVLKGITLGLVGLAIGYSQPVNAQTPYQNVQGSNFDLWCQEHEKLPRSVVMRERQGMKKPMRLIATRSVIMRKSSG